jgi:hypothetical protein
MFPAHASGGCNIEADELYQRFKAYRLQINTAKRLEQLNVFFSTNFIRYYEEKLRQAAGKNAKQRYLNQYWYNLTTADDVIIVFDYDMRCTGALSVLQLISVLQSTVASNDPTIELWQVNVYYTMENGHWLINSFEYQPYRQRATEMDREAKDNFFTLD